jgi:hypothetical protein
VGVLTFYSVKTNAAQHLSRRHAKALYNLIAGAVNSGWESGHDGIYPSAPFGLI